MLKNYKINKQNLRIKLLAIRQNTKRYNKYISNTLSILLNIYSPSCLAFYWPCFGEFDVRATIITWLEKFPNSCSALPVVKYKNLPLSFYYWYRDSLMTIGNYGIPIPTNSIDVIPDMIIIPCLGFDNYCFRLGYGGGFYDRTLFHLTRRPFTIGISFDQNQVNIIPRESHDIPLNFILTESQIIQNTNN